MNRIGSLRDLLRDIQGIFANEVPKAIDATKTATKIWGETIAENQKNIDDLNVKLGETNQQLQDAVRLGGWQSANARMWLDVQRAITVEIEKGVAAQQKLVTAQINAQIGRPQEPPPVTPRDFGRDKWGKDGKQPPAVATGGGGGGRTDEDTIEAQIKRYDELGNRPRRPTTPFSNSTARRLTT